MTEQDSALPASLGEPAPTPGPQAMLNAQQALRLVLLLLTVWTLLSGLTLTFFQAASAATIGGGLEGGQGEAAQRLLGVHLLVLAPVYGLIAWQPERYRLIAWIPYAAQAGVVAVTLFDIATGARDVQGGLLPFFVAVVFLVLLLYVWRAGRVPAPPTSDTAALPAPSDAAQPEPTPEPQPEDVSD